MDATAIPESIGYLDDCLRGLNEAAADREFTADEQTSFDDGLAERARLVTLLERHNLVAQLAHVPAHVESGDGARFTAPNVIVRDDPFAELRYDATPQQVRSKALAAIDKAGYVADAHKERAEELVRKHDASNGPDSVAKRVLLTGSDEYRQAFGKLVAGGSGAMLSTDERDMLARAAASLTGTAGGYAVPYVLDPSVIISGDGSANPFRAISRVETVTQDTWKGVSSAGVTSAFGAEASAITDGGLTVAQPTVTCERATCRIDYSWEIGADWQAFESEMATLLNDSKNELEASKFATGSGTNEPFGIVTALVGTASEINVSSSEALVAADVYAMEDALGPRFRGNASFVANRSIYNLIRQFDTGGGAQLWERIGAGLPAQLLGYPVYESSAMDGAYNAAATANNYIAILGDFRNFLIADRIGMSVIVNPITVNGSGDPTGQSSLISVWRVGSDSINDAAFTLLDLPTTA